MTDWTQDLRIDHIEEYKLCQQKAEALERNVYTTASIFGTGSIVVLATAFNVILDPQGDAAQFPPGPLLIAIFILGLVAIGGWFTWIRLALRWLSIANVMFIRMEHIERGSSLRANLYVRHMNLVKDESAEETTWQTFFTNNPDLNDPDQPFLDDWLRNNLYDHTEAYEHRSQFTMLKFFSGINIASWLGLIIFQSGRYLIEKMCLNSHDVIMGILLFLVGIFYVIYLRHSWQQR
jgi:hypothetical protein